VHKSVNVPCEWVQDQTRNPTQPNPTTMPQNQEIFVTKLLLTILLFHRAYFILI